MNISDIYGSGPMIVKKPFAGYRFALAILAERDYWNMPMYLKIHIDPFSGMTWWLNINGITDIVEQYRIISDWINWGPPAEMYYLDWISSYDDEF